MNPDKVLKDTQRVFLESLGIYQAGYAPEGAWGKGAIRYADEDLRNRLNWAGIQASSLRRYMEGEISLTLRNMIVIAQAALGDYVQRRPDLIFTLTVEKN